MFGIGNRKDAIWSRALVILLLVLSSSPVCLGQASGSATLRVTVKDPNGAVVPKATVILTSERTGEQRRAETSGEGTTGFASLNPGTYTVRIEATNFKASEQRISLNPNDTRGLEVTLEVGAPTETVTVTAEAEQIQTETGARENTITAQQIDNLSIVSRSSLELLRILPGVVAPFPDDPGFQSIGFNSGANANSRYNVNGVRGENNNVSIDGSRVIDIGSNNGTIITANNDMVQEVKVQTSNYLPEYGASGVQITATTKGGGREFHGTLYDYLRHYKLNANDRSRATFGLERQKEIYQYPGGNIGGPICLPRFGEGGPVGNCFRDKLFFFFGFEIQRQKVDPGVRFDLVPTLEQRQGRNFRHQYTGGIFNLDPSQITPIGRAFLNLYPLPNFNDPTGRFNYQFSGLQPINRTQGVLRFDYKPNDKVTAYLRLARESEEQDYARGLWWNPSAYELPSHVLGTNLGRSAALNITTVINPTMTNETVLSASKLMLDNDYREPEKVSLSALGIANYTGPFGQQSPYAPVAFITSWGGLTQGDFWEPGGLPLFAHNSSYSVSNTLTKISGAHTLKFGGLIEQANKYQNLHSAAEGLLIYAPWGNGSTGNSFADILVGKPAQYSQDTRTPRGKFRLYNYEAFAQDSWKVRPNLTVEYGVRFAYFPTNKELTGRAVLFDPKAYVRSQGVLVNGDPKRPNGILQAARGEIPDGLTDNPAPLWMPRLGFAWDIGGRGEMVIRGGAGVFYNRVQGNYQYYVITQPPNAYSASFNSYSFDLNYANLGRINPFGSVGNVGIDSANPESIAVPRTTNASLTLERRLPFGNIATIGYVGTFGRHLPQQRQINYIPIGRLLSGTVGNADLSNPLHRAALNDQVLAQFRPFPAYGSVRYKEFTATSNYHSLQATLSRRAGNLTYFATYTFSKALGITGVNETGDEVDPVDARGRSYGVLPFDRTHVFNLSYNYNVPGLARGVLDNRFARGLLNGWQMSGITTYASGIPIRLRFSGDISPNGNIAIAYFGTNAFTGSRVSAGGIAPIFLRNPQINGGSSIGDRMFDLSAIAIPPLGTTGPTIQPYYLRSPHRWNHDVSFFKNFKISETKKIQFRAGLFNIFNQAYPQWFGPDDPNNDIYTRLIVVCNQRVNGVPNGAGGTADNICDPTKGFRFSDETINNFGKIVNKRGHRIIELALKFYF